MRRISTVIAAFGLVLLCTIGGVGDAGPDSFGKIDAPHPGRPLSGIRPDSAQRRLASLPIPAQGAISARLGEDLQAYHAVRTDRGYSARNPHHDLSLDFDDGGVAVASGAST